jgi:hypothetical protein
MTLNSNSTNVDSVASAQSDRHIVTLVLAAWALLLILIACLAAGRPAPCVGDDPANGRATCAALEVVGAIGAPSADRREG